MWDLIIVEFEWRKGAPLCRFELSSKIESGAFDQILLGIRQDAYAYKITKTTTELMDERKRSE